MQLLVPHRRRYVMGMFEKRRARSFFIFVQDYEENDPKTHKGYNLDALTSRELFAKFGLEANTVDFIGHALALQDNEHYLDQPARKMVMAVKLYSESLARFDTGSPYIYPLYGLGELPQGFARLSAVYGGTYMLAKPDATVVYDEAGKATGVTSEGETAKAKFVIGDPSYFPGKCRRVGQVVRALCILSHPIPNCGDSHSVQIILPQKQTGRQTDMYVFGCSYAHNVCAKVGGSRGLGPSPVHSIHSHKRALRFLFECACHHLPPFFFFSTLMCFCISFPLSLDTRGARK